MPQIDLSHFFYQTFISVFIFITFLSLFALFYLYPLLRVIKLRNKLKKFQHLTKVDNTPKCTIY